MGNEKITVERVGICGEKAESGGKVVQVVGGPNGSMVVPWKRWEELVEAERQLNGIKREWDGSKATTPGKP